MSKIKFDKPRLVEMEHFLTRLYQIGNENSDVKIDVSLVYRELCRYELSTGDIKSDGNSVNCAELFRKWIDRNNNVGSLQKGLTVYHQLDWPNFLQFFSSDDSKYFDENPHFIKLYIPMKYKSLFESVNILFDYIRDSKMRHCSKVANIIRTDNIVVRLAYGDIESALKIIDFVNSNNVIKNNLNQTNPFIPTINGIGFMYETGISYNKEMSILIANYVNICIKSQTVPALSGFYKWFKENNHSNELDSIFAYTIGEKDSVDLKDDKNQTNQFKYQLLIEAIKATFLKYGLFQTVGALKKLIEEGNYDYFTNGTGEIKYRDLLCISVTRDDAIKYIKALFNKNGYVSDNDIIDFCEIILKKNLLNEFCEACYVTYANYDRTQLESALKSMINRNDSSEFSRFSRSDTNKEKNYREIIEKYDRKGIINLIKLFLSENDVDYEQYNTDELISLYSDKIISFTYSDDEKQEKTR